MKKVSIDLSFANTSAAHAPEGPPPTTATLYFIEGTAVEDARTRVEAARLRRLEEGTRASTTCAATVMRERQERQRKGGLLQGVV